MVAKKKKSAGSSSSRLVRSLIIIVVVAVLIGVSAKVTMESLNRKMGLETNEVSQPVDTVVTEESQEVAVMPDFDPASAIGTGSAIWAPDWKSTPCSLYISEESEAIFDSLQQSPQPDSRNTELQLLVELWAGYSGFEQMEIERVWVFASGDTCFIDLPRSADWQGVRKTIESRFISYSILFPFVAGEILEGFEEGIPVAGVPSVR